MPAIRALLTVITTAAASLVPGVATARTTQVRWQPCAENATVQCGTLTVPLDWSRPNGPTIDLALARRRADDPSARIGSVLANFGGPGADAVEPLINGHSGLGPAIERRFDIVGWDPRGVGRSSPIVCSAAAVDRMVQLVNGRLPANQAEFDEIADQDRRLFADCRAHTGPSFDHVDTLSTVRDLDAIRAALGEATLTFYGASYGTLIGQQYAELFPDRVRAIVLDGVVDHSLDTRRYWDTTAAAVQDSFDEFVAWSDASPTSALYGRDARLVWRRLLERTASGEIPSPSDPRRPLRSEELVGLAYGHFNAPDWPGLAAALDALGLRSTGARRAETPEVIPFPALIWCFDWSLPVTDHRQLARHLRRAARIAPDMRYFPEAPIASSFACLGGPSPVPNPQHRLRLRHVAAPLLLVNARHDPTSSYAWASAVARQAGRRAAVLLTYDGAGHVNYGRGRGRCVDEAVDRYLLDQVLPAPGATCPAVRPG